MSGGTEAYVYEFLPIYYDRFFPFEDLVGWMGGEEKNKKREIAFQLPPEIYIRFQSYHTAQAWREAVKKSKPDRMEIGPLYSQEPRMKDGVHKDMFFAEERELIFDIDMDDYDEVRTCCTGAKICRKCWVFLKAAMLLLDHILREDFGFQHLMFVYSGRRGVHCWVSDPEVMRLTNEQRSAIIEYVNLFNLQSFGVQAVKLEKNNATVLHPHVTRSAKLLEPHLLEKILPEQRPLNPPLADNKHLKIIEATLQRGKKPELVTEFQSLCSRIEQKMTGSEVTGQSVEQVANQASTDIYRHIEKLSKSEVGANKPESEALQYLAAETALRLLFPRLDANVTKQLNHLAKSPFCIHPKTGRVCVPIVDPKTFDFETVPTLGQLIDEINAGGKVNSLEPYLKWFHTYCAGLEKARAAFSAANNSMDID
ncbi:unnamed protein product [Amoebophrya sp. A25]|nr:unnamed protein product [Amoebophrya sp. A25]|eukprot:GSA25T00011091001.1